MLSDKEYHALYILMLDYREAFDALPTWAKKGFYERLRIEQNDE